MTLADQGAYVRYQHEAMVGLLAGEAARSGGVAIGEDLGTVEQWMRDYLAARRVLGTSMLWFARRADGTPLPPRRWRRDCLATVGTHDVPPARPHFSPASTWRCGPGAARPAHRVPGLPSASSAAGGGVRLAGRSLAGQGAAPAGRHARPCGVHPASCTAVLPRPHPGLADRGCRSPTPWATTGRRTLGRRAPPTQHRTGPAGGRCATARDWGSAARRFPKSSRAYGTWPAWCPGSRADRPAGHGPGGPGRPRRP